jgi:peptide chain release factor 1
VKPSLRNKLESLSDRLQELDALLADPHTIGDQSRFRALSMEYAQVNPLVSCFRKYQSTLDEIADTEAMLEDDDSAVRVLAEEELLHSRQQLSNLEQEIKILLVPSDPHDNADIFLEIRAGTGGNEAALFAGDLFRMYLHYAEIHRWHTEIISYSEGEQGGYKEIVLRIAGQGVYSRLKFESGVHRVQRVPVTESQGRIHTSACTVAVLAEADEIDQIDVNPADLKIDTFRASGAGGQHVNKTDSAIRLTHLPTARLLAQAQEKQLAEQAQQRKTMVGSGDRSERIRTYNFPQGRVTDHRINLTLYKLDEILQGQLDQVIHPLINEYQAEQLAEMGVA